MNSVRYIWDKNLFFSLWLSIVTEYSISEKLQAILFMVYETSI
jgi:hypothetical protein